MKTAATKAPTSVAVNGGREFCRNGKRPSEVPGSHGPALSPLAAEILADLTCEFPKGANVSELISWLGEPRARVRAALKELLVARLAYRSMGRLLHGQPRQRSTTDSAIHRPEILRRRSAGQAPTEIARELQISIGSVRNVIDHRNHHTVEGLREWRAAREAAR